MLSPSTSPDIETSALVLSTDTGRRGLVDYARRLLGPRLPALSALLRFCLVGASGVLVNLVVLAVSLHLAGRAPGVTAQAVAETVATQVAILWNFVLTEGWVFDSTRASAGRLRRLAGYWAVSMGSLAVQLPLTRGLDRVLPLGYVAATCVCLLVLVGARYVVCRAVLYRPAVAGGGAP